MKLILPLLAVIMLFAGFWLYQETQTAPTPDADEATPPATDTAEQSSDRPVDTPDDQGDIQTEETPDTTGTSSDPSTERAPSGDEREFTIEASNYAFSDEEIRVSQGDMVTINFSSTEGSHDFVIDELAVATPVIDTDEVLPITFIAEETGTFEYYCSVGDHRAQGMTGTLIVE